VKTPARDDHIGYIVRVEAMKTSIYAEAKTLIYYTLFRPMMGSC